jgi:mannitol/fructose-specific phosphotransferase system IIA component
VGLDQSPPRPGQGGADGTDRELLFRLFQAREAAASTGIGDGIAIPHVRNPIVLHVTKPLIALCFLTTLVSTLFWIRATILINLVSLATKGLSKFTEIGRAHV